MIKKKKEEERREMKRFKGKKPNPNPLFSCVWVLRKPLLCVKCSWMVLVQFEVVLHFFDWFGLVLRNFCVKEMMKFQRSCCQKFSKPLFLFWL